MKNISFFFLVFICFNISIYSQLLDSIPIFEYEINYNLGLALTKKGYVFKSSESVHFNSTKSVFLNYRTDNVGVDDKGNPEIYKFAKGAVNESLIIDLNKKVLLKLGSYASDPVVVKETLVPQQWKATGVKKRVSERNCVEFKTNFRGRDYIAYIDLSVPFHYGPWKFNNLPGLLVAIEDSKKQLSWKLMSIRNIPLEKSKEYVKKQTDFMNGFKVISLKEFVPLYDKSKGGTRSIGASRLPRDFKEVKSNKIYKRTGMELKYEWEE